ncbi:Hypothetical_protein [Hexamita inflata]|uniref:Hypothetical_protein n=1 Tax=Hexamita inflata TaxID=28002 RepID=A0AA86THQ5_9EUKA|nr:Hypothetical protein HINF_LOCUS5221 [Hexamita inflata]
MICCTPEKGSRLLEKSYTHFNKQIVINNKSCNRLIDFCRFNPDKILQTVKSISNDFTKGLTQNKVGKIETNLQILIQLLQSLISKFEQESLEIVLNILKQIPVKHFLLFMQILHIIFQMQIKKQDIVDRASLIFMQKVTQFNFSQRLNYYKESQITSTILGQRSADKLTACLYLYSICDGEEETKEQFQLLFAQLIQKYQKLHQYDNIIQIIQVLEDFNVYLQNLSYNEQQMFYFAENSLQDSTAIFEVLQKQNQKSQLVLINDFIFPTKVYSRPKVQQTGIKKYIFGLFKSIESVFEPASITDLYNFLVSQQLMLEQHLTDLIIKLAHQTKTTLADIVHRLPEDIIKNKFSFKIAEELFKTENGLDYALIVLKYVLINQKQFLDQILTDLLKTCLQNLKQKQKKSRLYTKLSDFLHSETVDACQNFTEFLNQCVDKQPERVYYFYVLGRKLTSAVPQNSKQLINFYAKIAPFFNVQFSQSLFTEFTIEMETNTPYNQNDQSNQLIKNVPNYLEVSQTQIESLNYEQVIQMNVNEEKVKINELAEELSKIKSTQKGVITDKWKNFVVSIYGQ